MKKLKHVKLFEDFDSNFNIEELAKISDKALDDAYHYGRSTPGNNFGWLANVESAKAAKRLIDSGETDIEKISDAVHDGWNITAMADYNDELHLDNPTSIEKKEKRKKLADKSYYDLPEEEKEKDRVVARALLKAIKGINENILPKSYKKVKCLECGEEVCDNINYKIGHLYNKHNCKPSVGDYKAKKMLKQYFPAVVKESFEPGIKYDFVDFQIDEILSSDNPPRPDRILKYAINYLNTYQSGKEWWCENFEKSIEDAMDEYDIDKKEMINHIKAYIGDYGD